MKKYLIAVGIILAIFAGFTFYGNRVENERKEQEASNYLKERNERYSQAFNKNENVDIDLFIPTEPPPDIYDDFGNVIDRSIMNISAEEVLEDYDYMWAVLGENYPYYDIEEELAKMQRIKQKYLDEINGQIEKAELYPHLYSIDIYWLSDLTDRCLGEFNSPGVIYISPEIYFYSCILYDVNNKNEKSRHVYRLLKEKEYAGEYDGSFIEESENPFMLAGDMLPNSGLLFQYAKIKF